MVMTICIFGVMAVLMLINTPIGFALGISTLVGTIVAGDIPIMVLAQRIFFGLDSFTLIAIPLFILTGQFMSLGGITRDLLELSRVFVGQLRGGLAYINIIASMIFAGITGSAASDSSSIGSILIPAMTKKGYDKDFTVAVTASSSTIGILIPPSIPFVLYGVATNTSIGNLFIAGVVPGLMVAGGLMLISFFFVRKYNYPKEEKMGLKQGIMTCIRSMPALMTVVILIGGIVSGIFTATEAACIAAVYTFLLGTLYYKELKLKDIPKIIIEVAKTMGMVALMIASASALGWVLTNQSIPQAISEGIFMVTENKYIVLLLLNVLLLFVGTWMDITPAMIVFAPILFPLAMEIGLDPVHFGIIMTMNFALGLVTPPVGICLFISCGIAKLNMAYVLKAFMPFFVIMFIILILITYIPELVLFLPNLIF